MKKKTIWKKQCGSLLAGALLTGAVALVGWQGIRSFSDAKTPAKVHRLAAESSAVSAVSSSVSVSVPESSVSSSAKATRKAASSKSAAATESTRTVCDVSTPMNLNTATAEELQVLPGIGEVLAQRIVAYREQIGGFRNLEQLLEVNGIGTVKYVEIVPMLYLPEETPDEEENAGRGGIAPAGRSSGGVFCGGHAGRGGDRCGGTAGACFLSNRSEHGNS